MRRLQLVAYGYESRVTGITYPNSSTNSFTYNGLDTRVGKTDSAGTKTFRRDGAYVTDPVLSDGSTTFTPGVSTRNGTTTKLQHEDYLGTNVRQTDSSQTVSSNRRYDAFGMLMGSTGAQSGPFGFAGGYGYQADADSGLMLLGHRYYDPSTGRFLTRDPIKHGPNWYAYANNNPTSFVDPEGLKPGDKYATSDAAAIAAGEGGRNFTDKTGFEAGGWIYRNADGTWSYTMVTDGNPVGVHPGPQPPNASGIWHSHPKAGLPYPGKPGFVTGDSNNASKPDDWWHNNTYGPDYIVGAGGVVWKFPKKGPKVPIGRRP